MDDIAGGAPGSFSEVGARLVGQAGCSSPKRHEWNRPFLSLAALAGDESDYTNDVIFAASIFKVRIHTSGCMEQWDMIDT
jgi:hypothetical protein